MAKNIILFTIAVIAVFLDKENPGKKLNPGDTLTTADLDRVNNLVHKGFGVIKSVDVAANQDDNPPKAVSVLGTEYDLAKVKEALNAIGIETAKNLGVDAVAKKVTELTDEQANALSAKLSE